MFLGLRTIIYPAPDLERSKGFSTDLLGYPPYFEESFYVGFDEKATSMPSTPTLTRLPDR